MVVGDETSNPLSWSNGQQKCGQNTLMTSAAQLNEQTAWLGVMSLRASHLTHSDAASSWPAYTTNQWKPRRQAVVKSKLSEKAFSRNIFHQSEHSQHCNVNLSSVNTTRTCFLSVVIFSLTSFAQLGFEANSVLTDNLYPQVTEFVVLITNLDTTQG